MRISDWSSDVCSSDLHRIVGVEQLDALEQILRRVFVTGRHVRDDVGRALEDQRKRRRHRHGATAGQQRQQPADPAVVRSEEHTSELQSLMRISYAVFCLKKKIHNRTTTIA